MKYNLLNEYPKSLSPRVVGKSIRTINHRLIATKRDKEFFDGDRNFGYGGFIYDGRWKAIAKKICNEFLLKKIVPFFKLIVKKDFFYMILSN